MGERGWALKDWALSSGVEVDKGVERSRGRGVEGSVDVDEGTRTRASFFDDNGPRPI